MTQQRVSPITVTSLLPATVLFRGQAALGQSADLLQLNNSSGTTLSKFDSAGLLTVPNVAVTSTTIPANGMYLPSANTLGFAANSTAAMNLTSSLASFTGSMDIGTGAGTGVAYLQIGNTRTGDGIAYIDIVSDTTYTDYGLRIIRSAGANGASGFTTRGTGGIYLTTTEAGPIQFNTTNLLRMTIDSSGRVGIGTINTSTTLTTAKSMTGATVIYGILNNGTIASDVTSVARYYSSNPATAASAFTIGEVSSFYANSVSIGATSTVTNQYGFIAGALSGATNNYSFAAQSTAAANVWNFYASGTAANYFAGQTTVGSTSLTLGSSSAAQQFGVVSTAAANVGAVIRGAASQTANLQEWQNSAGTVLASFTSGGNLGINVAAAVPLHISGTQIRLDNEGATDPTLYLRNTTGWAKIQWSGAGSGIRFMDASSALRLSIDGNGNFFLGNSGLVPSANPTGGGVLYVEAGALKYRGSSGTITTIANA